MGILTLYVPTDEGVLFVQATVDNEDRRAVWEHVVKSLQGVRYEPD